MARILNLDIAEFTVPELLQELHRGAVYTPNIDHLVKCQTDREFYEAYAQAEYIICDSRIVYWLSKLSKGHIPCLIPDPAFSGISTIIMEMMNPAGFLCWDLPER